MKQITVKIIILTVFAWTACLAQAAGEDRVGLYSPKSKTQVTEQPAVKQSFGLYEAPQAEGILRAGGTEGDDGGNPNKVPVRDNLLLLLMGAAAYLVIRKNSKRRFLDL